MVQICCLVCQQFCGMLDMYSDFTMFQAQTGAHLQVLEMCDLDKHLQKPTEEQLNWSAKVAVAQEELVEEFDLDALTYYYHGAPGNHEDL